MELKLMYPAFTSKPTIKPWVSGDLRQEGKRLIYSWASGEHFLLCALVKEVVTEEGCVC